MNENEKVEPKIEDVLLKILLDTYFCAFTGSTASCSGNVVRFITASSAARLREALKRGRSQLWAGLKQKGGGA